MTGESQVIEKSMKNNPLHRQSNSMLVQNNYMLYGEAKQINKVWVEVIDS